MASTKQKLKISQQKGVLTLQGQKFAVQALFSTPILQICNYLEHLQKYRYRSALSSCNLKIDEFDEYYKQVKQRAQQLYSGLLYNSLAIIQDLIIAVKFAKIELWHQQAALAQGLRNNLYLKQLDPYNFNVKQFDESRKQAVNTLDMAPTSVQTARDIVESLAKKLKQVQAEKMEDMFCGKVINPYLAQNKEGDQLDPSSIYSSYSSYLKIKLERADQALLRKHFLIHEDVIKFGQAIFDHTLKSQSTAAQLIRKYYENTDLQNAELVPASHVETRRYQIDADQLSTGKQSRSQLKPALINKHFKVEFKTTNRMLNLETGSQQLVEHTQNQQRSRLNIEPEGVPRENPFTNFTERRRMIQKEYQPFDLQRRGPRQDDFRFNFKDPKEKQKQKVIVRRIVRTTIAPAPWSQFSEWKYSFFYFLQCRQQKEHSIWQIKGRQEEPKGITYRIPKQDKKELTQMNEKTQTQLTLEEIQRDKQRIQEEELFEKRRTREEEVRLRGLTHLIESKSYEKFLALSKIQARSQPTSTKDHVTRYGISLKFPLQYNNQADNDKFFYYYFKQRYYRQNSEVKQNIDNPIVFLDENKVNMSASHKIVSQLLGSITKRINNTGIFLLWSRDMVSFSQTKERGVVTNNFECFCYGQPSNCEKMMYELRRRTTGNFVENIKITKQLDKEQQIYSKIEIAHRSIYNRHQPRVNFYQSVTKGRQIAEEIFKSLKNQ